MIFTVSKLSLFVATFGGAALLTNALPSNPTVFARDTPREDIKVNGVLNEYTCAGRTMSINHITAAIQDSVARDLDGRRVPNPKKSKDPNPFPHQFRQKNQLTLSNECEMAQDVGNVKEFPILEGDGLFDENSKDVGNDRVFYLHVAGAKEATLCTLGTHEGAEGKKFINC